MKQTLILLAASVILVISCKKKADTTDCYICTSTSYIQSNAPSYVTPVITNGAVEICYMNEARIKEYERSHTKTDTVYMNGDTLRTEHIKFDCGID